MKAFFRVLKGLIKGAALSLQDTLFVFVRSVFLPGGNAVSV